VSYGILNTTASSFTAYGSYVVDGLLSGFMYTANATEPQPLQLAPPSTLTGDTNYYYIYYSNDNEFSLSSSSEAYTDAYGLGLTSAYGSFDLWDDRVTCSGLLCGQYGSMIVQRYNATVGNTLPCAPQGTTLQFSFCLQTGSSSTGQQNAESWSRIVTGRFNSTATLLQSGSLTTVGAIVQGSSITSSNSTPVAVELAAPSTLRALYANDNAFYVPSGAGAAPEAAVTDGNGIGFVTADGVSFVVYASGASASNPFSVLGALQPPHGRGCPGLLLLPHHWHGRHCTADALNAQHPHQRHMECDQSSVLIQVRGQRAALCQSVYGSRLFVVDSGQCGSSAGLHCADSSERRHSADRQCFLLQCGRSQLHAAGQLRHRLHLFPRHLCTVLWRGV
jgi:hypothetical protein